MITIYTFGALLALLTLVLSCSKSTDPDTNKPPDNGPVGIVLSGGDTDSALLDTIDHGTFALPEWDAFGMKLNHRY